MATVKKTVKKTTPPIETPAPAAKTRSRETVLVQVTASWLKDKIGADTKIGVSRKHLKALIVAQTTGDVLGDLPE